jgi:hypothetical protein
MFLFRDSEQKPLRSSILTKLQGEATPHLIDKVPHGLIFNHTVAHRQVGGKLIEVGYWRTRVGDGTLSALSGYNILIFDRSLNCSDAAEGALDVAAAAAE